jgi:hypothetical protein
MVGEHVVVTSVVATLGVVVGTAGFHKVLRPGPARSALAALGAPASAAAARALGVVELLVALTALTAPARVAGPAIGGIFAAFALATLRLRDDGSRSPAGCGCFGKASDEAPGRMHAVANALAAAAGIFAASTPASGALHEWASDPKRGMLVLGPACVGAASWKMGFSPRRPAVARSPRVGERLVETSATFLERRFSRRSALLRFAVAGSALSVAPLRYLLYPGTALAVVVPSSCSTGDCTDGYTAFCCEINDGVNACPSGTFPGGWWKCTDYTGHNLCAAEGVRYYVDCNRLPGYAFPGGCRCAGNDCSSRRVDCNVFRYGQCNTQIEGTTEVVCRLVTCQNPGTIPSLNCGSSLKVDNGVCGHDVPCLSNQVIELAGAGGV